jgi:hypothetical protein
MLGIQYEETVSMTVGQSELHLVELKVESTAVMKERRMESMKVVM